MEGAKNAMLADEHSAQLALADLHHSWLQMEHHSSSAMPLFDFLQCSEGSRQTKMLGVTKLRIRAMVSVASCAQVIAANLPQAQTLHFHRPLLPLHPHLRLRQPRPKQVSKQRSAK